MVSALSYGIPRVPHYSGFTSPSLGFRIQDFHLLWFTFPGNSTNLNLDFFGNPNPENITTLGLGSSSFARHYLRNRSYFLFLWVLRCFSSPRSPSYTALLMYEYTVSFYCMSSLIRTSTDISDICSSPWLFAAYHVLLRLLVPRHSPYALCSLTSAL